MMMRRQVLCGMIFCVLGIPAAFPQSATGIRRIGYLHPGLGPSRRTVALQESLARRGWIEGRNLHIEYGWGANQPERLVQVADALVRASVELIVASSTPAAQVAIRSTRTVPIVLGPIADAVGSGFVTNMARPGGNVTGVSLMLPSLGAKRFELLRELNAKISHVAYLAWRPDPAHGLFLRQAEEAAKFFNVRIRPLAIGAASELGATFDIFRRERVDALVVQPLFAATLGLANRIAEMAIQHRLPTMSDGEGFADAGGLMFYGPNLEAIHPRIADYVDRILKGAKPADMPIEMPSHYELAINQSTARKLGIRLPKALIARADRVIG